MSASIDTDTLIDMFSKASTKQGEQLRQAVRQATLGALQGRELNLKNIREALKSVTKAASAGLSQNPLPRVDAEALLDKAVAGMDDALLKAVEAHRLALQQFAEHGVGLQEKQLKKAVAELEKIEDVLIETVRKGAETAAKPMAAAWSHVLQRLNAGGTASGAEATLAAERFSGQMQQALREGRVAGLKAAQALAQSYAALASGVLIGMSDALQQSRAAAKKTTPKT